MGALRKNTLITLIIATHIVYSVLHIHKQTLFIKESYRKQKNEKIKNELDHELRQLTQQLHRLRDYAHIELFARNSLHMRPIQLHHIKKLSTT